MTTEPLNGSSVLRTFFSFPHPVNEYAARSVAFMVFVLALFTIAADIRWLTFALAYGFLARVLTGPKASPMGQLATRFIAPKILKRSRWVAGPPKQFAQTVGLTFSLTSIVLIYGFGLVGTAYAVLGVLVVFAGLEAFVGFCMGCYVFGYLMRWGLIPAEMCERCNDINMNHSANSS
jgi:hypothetical protein